MASGQPLMVEPVRALEQSCHVHLAQGPNNNHLA